MSTATTSTRDRMVPLIRSIASAAGLPAAVALATAEVEGNFNPRAQGDLKWHEKKGGELYRKNVRDNPRFADNPARLQPELWHSYGAFQLLAPYHLEPNEHPHVLLDPTINAQRGVRMLARLFKHYNGDVAKVRVHYGAGSQNVSEATRATLLERFLPAYEKWSRDDGGSGGSSTPPKGGSGWPIALGMLGLFLLLRKA